MTSPIHAIPFTEFRSRLLALYEPPLRAASTRQRMAQVLDLVALLPGVLSTADLTSTTVAMYITERAKAVKVNTIVGELGYLKAACGFAVGEGLLERSPFHSKRLRLRREPPARKAWHSLAELSRLLEHLRERSAHSWREHRLYAVVAVVAYTGLRRDEALSLRCADYRPELCILEVVERGLRLKTLAAAQPVPVPDELAAILAAWLPRTASDWLFPNHVKRETPWLSGAPGTKPLDQLKAAGDRVGIKFLTYQSLRHSWATHAETAWGLAEGQIQRVLRHTSPITSHLYRHADIANLRTIGQRVTFRAG